MTVPPAWRVRDRVLPLDRPLVMGIVNVTPDSFSDGGQFLEVDAAVRHAIALVDEGADIIDLGGESTRPHGAREISLEEERYRILPVVRELVRRMPGVIISVDTVKSVVAEAALGAGAMIVNDVSAFRLDPRLADVVAASGAGAILMHSRGTVSDMATYTHAEYAGDVVEVVLLELATQVRMARAAGIASDAIALDPGIGFAKRSGDSLRLLAGLAAFEVFGAPLVIGASRKRVIGRVTGVSDPRARVHGSVGAAVAAYERGASIFRVHDVAATRQALDVAAAIRGAARSSVPA